LNLHRFLEAQSFVLAIKKVKEDTIKKVKLQKLAPDMLEVLKWLDKQSHLGLEKHARIKEIIKKMDLK
jgi:hypothetical protein